MSLIAKATGENSIQPIEPGTYPAICSMVVDLGMQFNEERQKNELKVLIGWELPFETIMIKDEKKTRTVYRKFTNSINDQATLRKFLETWRSKAFTKEELAGFDLCNIVGVSCYVTVFNREYNGRIYTNVSAATPLPKGIEKGELSQPPVIFDLDVASAEDVDRLPNWIAETIKKSVTYQEKLIVPKGSKIVDLDDDGDLPF